MIPVPMASLGFYALLLVSFCAGVCLVGTLLALALSKSVRKQFGRRRTTGLSLLGVLAVVAMPYFMFGVSSVLIDRRIGAENAIVHAAQHATLSQPTGFSGVNATCATLQGICDVNVICATPQNPWERACSR